MKIKFVMAAAALIMFGCATKMSVYKTHAINAAEPACKNPAFVSSIAKKSVEIDDLTLYSLLKWAQTNYGAEVSLQNVIWEEKNGKKITVVFDVVRCNPLKEN